MAAPGNPTPSPRPPRRSLTFLGRLRRRWKEEVFQAGVLAAAAVLLVIVLALIVILVEGSKLTLEQYGIAFLWGPIWQPLPGYGGTYGAFPFLVGTVETSAIALVIAIPLSLGIAIFLTERSPAWIRLPLGSVVDLLAAVPSVVYGFWGFVVLVPLIGQYVYPTIGSFSPVGSACHSSSYVGTGILTSGIILAVMIVPTISALSREALLAVPQSQREAVLSLGATRWEATRIGALKYARSGIFGAVILGLGRAVGETMAVVMTVGNDDTLPQCLTSGASTMASVIANEFPDPANLFQDKSALIEIGLVLLLTTLMINIVARTYIWRLSRVGGA